MTGGHEMVVTHDIDDTTYTPVCHEPPGADCRLDGGECQVVLWLTEDDASMPELAAGGDSRFEIGRFPIGPVWTGVGYEWQHRGGVRG